MALILVVVSLVGSAIYGRAYEMRESHGTLLIIIYHLFSSFLALIHRASFSSPRRFEILISF